MNWSFLTWHDEMTFNTRSAIDLYKEYEDHAARVDSQLSLRSQVIAKMENLSTGRTEWRAIPVDRVSEDYYVLLKGGKTYICEIQFVCATVEQVLKYIDGNQKVLPYWEINGLKNVLEHLKYRRRLI